MFKHCVICNENITLFVMIMITDSGKALIRGDQILLADLKYRSTTSEQMLMSKILFLPIISENSRIVYVNLVFYKCFFKKRKMLIRSYL